MLVPTTTTASGNFTLTAAAPIAPPAAHFSIPESLHPTPMTYDEESGQVFGHLALWNSCHRGFMNGASGECVGPPRTKTDYGQFHLGRIKTAEGDLISVGKITFDAPHAPLTADVQAASRHYDDTGTVGAYVRASDGRLGIWLSGTLRPDLPPEGLVALRANPLSGDWRAVNRNLELVAALAVPVPGFVIPALAASGDVSALLYSPDSWEADMSTYTPSELRQKRVLIEEAASLTAAVFTQAERDRLAKSGAAMPDGSFPIRNCSDFMNARRAIGRANPGDRAAVEAHIRKRGRMLGCDMSGM